MRSKARKRELQPSQTHQDAGQLPERGSGAQAALLGSTQRRQVLDAADLGQEGGDEPLYDPV